MSDKFDAMASELFLTGSDLRGTTTVWPTAHEIAAALRLADERGRADALLTQAQASALGSSDENPNAYRPGAALISAIVNGTTIVRANALLHSLTAEVDRLCGELVRVTKQRDELRALEQTVREQATLIAALKAESERLRGELKWATRRKT